MTPNEAIEVTYDAFKTGWAASTEAATAVAYDGNPFTPVVDAPFVLLSVRHFANLQDTLGQPGNRRFERQAIVLVECAAPGGKGRQRADQLARAASEIFEGKTISDVTFLVAQTAEAGTDGQWYRALVSVPFRYYETK